MSQAGVAGRGSGHAPLILYSPVSWLLVLRMLRADEALDPTVSTRSKPRCGSCRSGSRFSSCAAAVPVRRAKGLRMGILETGEGDYGRATTTTTGGRGSMLRGGNCVQPGSVDDGNKSRRWRSIPV